MSEMGIGIIGAGFMGRTYMETLTQYCPDVKVRAVTGGSRAGPLAKDYAVEQEESVETLLNRDDVDIVFIATPHEAHGPQAIAAAGHGKHIMIEKPMACSVAECDDILKACQEAGVFCSVAFTQRSRLCNIRAKQIIERGDLGPVRQLLEFQWLGGGLVKFPSWQSNRENLGILFGHGIHNFDRIRWITGSEIATVYAHCTSLEPEIPVEGTSLLLMTLSDGTAVSFSSSGQLPEPPFPHMQFRAMIIGERGLMDIDAYGELRINTAGRWETVVRQAPIDWAGKGFLDPVRLESYADHCQAFLEAVQEQREPPITGWDGRQAVAAALAAYESSQSSRIVTLSP